MAEMTQNEVRAGQVYTWKLRRCASGTCSVIRPVHSTSAAIEHVLPTADMRMRNRGCRLVAAVVALTMALMISARAVTQQSVVQLCWPRCNCSMHSQTSSPMNRPSLRTLEPSALQTLRCVHVTPTRCTKRVIYKHFYHSDDSCVACIRL